MENKIKLSDADRKELLGKYIAILTAKGYRGFN
jgi:hypothetical protein